MTFQSAAQQPIVMDFHRLRIEAERPLAFEDGVRLRGFYGSSYRHLPAMEQFIKDSAIYRYPRMQYKAVDGSGVILGFDKAAEVLRTLPLPEALRIGKDMVAVTGIKSEDSTCSWGLAEAPRRYKFLTPWLCLDKNGLDKYFRLKRRDPQVFFLEDLLVKNILHVSRALGYQVPGTVEARICELKPVTIEDGDAPTMGFRCECEVNFQIPDGLGIGLEVARGYGTVEGI